MIMIKPLLIITSNEIPWLLGNLLIPWATGNFGERFYPEKEASMAGKLSIHRY